MEDELENEIELTTHAYERLKERAGLNKSAARRTAKKAWDLGDSSALIDGRFLLNKKADKARAYGKFVYLFKDNVLITVLNLETEYTIRKPKYKKGKRIN